MRLLLQYSRGADHQGLYWPVNVGDCIYPVSCILDKEASLAHPSPTFPFLSSTNAHSINLTLGEQGAQL